MATAPAASGAQSGLTSAEAVEAIVMAKQKERLEELEGIKLQVAAEHDEELRRATEEHRVLHEGNQRRKARETHRTVPCTHDNLYVGSVKSAAPQSVTCDTSASVSRSDRGARELNRRYFRP